MFPTFLVVKRTQKRRLGSNFSKTDVSKWPSALTRTFQITAALFVCARKVAFSSLVFDRNNQTIFNHFSLCRFLFSTLIGSNPNPIGSECSLKIFKTKSAHGPWSTLGTKIQTGKWFHVFPIFYIDLSTVINFHELT